MARCPCCRLAMRHRGAGSQASPRAASGAESTARSRAEWRVHPDAPHRIAVAAGRLTCEVRARFAGAHTAQTFRARFVRSACKGAPQDLARTRAQLCRAARLMHLPLEYAHAAPSVDGVVPGCPVLLVATDDPATSIGSRNQARHAGPAAAAAQLVDAVVPGTERKLAAGVFRGAISGTNIGGPSNLSSLPSRCSLRETCQRFCEAVRDPPGGDEPRRLLAGLLLAMKMYDGDVLLLRRALWATDENL